MPVATSPFPLLPAPQFGCSFRLRNPSPILSERSRLASIISAALWHPETPCPWTQPLQQFSLKTGEPTLFLVQQHLQAIALSLWPHPPLSPPGSRQAMLRSTVTQLTALFGEITLLYLGAIFHPWVDGIAKQSGWQSKQGRQRPAKGPHPHPGHRACRLCWGPQSGQSHPGSGFLPAQGPSSRTQGLENIPNPLKPRTLHLPVCGHKELRMECPAGGLYQNSLLQGALPHPHTCCW